MEAGGLRETTPAAGSPPCSSSEPAMTPVAWPVVTVSGDRDVLSLTMNSLLSRLWPPTIRLFM